MKNSQNSQNLLEKIANFKPKNCEISLKFVKIAHPEGKDFDFPDTFQNAPVRFLTRQSAMAPIRVKMATCGEDPETPLFLRHKDLENMTKNLHFFVFRSVDR